MKFDRRAPGEGVEAVCSLENAKAVLEWHFYFTEEAEENRGTQGDGAEGNDGYGLKGTVDGKGDWSLQSEIESIGNHSAKDAAESNGHCNAKSVVGSNGNYGIKSAGMVRLILTDMQGNIVLEGVQSLGEEEPLRSILLQPRLWRGTKDPYQYRLEAVLTDREGRCLDRFARYLPLRTFSGTCSAGIFTLNGEDFERRAVSYTPPYAASEAERQRLITEDFRQIVRMGANCIYVGRGEELAKLFLHLCDRLGLLLFYKECRKSDYVYYTCESTEIRIPWGDAVPDFWGEKDCLFVNGSKMPTTLFYRYLAKWSEEPFVYIIPESVEKLEDGNYAVRCYSNCGRIALYSDGTLFEFQRGEGEFTFLEVPAKTPSIMLTAEGDGCSASLSLSRIICQSAGKKPS